MVLLESSDFGLVFPLLLNEDCAEDTEADDAGLSDFEPDAKDVAGVADATSGAVVAAGDGGTIIPGGIINPGGQNGLAGILGL